MGLNFENITDGDHFEELVHAYFEKEKQNRNNQITDVIDNRKSGVGADGGRDILLRFRVSDGIDSFDRTWVVQCKFHNNNISTDVISDINIPSLIHSYKASGYLLICRKSPTNKLAKLFEDLNDKCKFDYSYRIWTGEQFKHLLLSTDESIWQQFFPDYYDEFKAKNNR